jgi:GMP synthase-like glutamine amidotransferase
MPTPPRVLILQHLSGDGPAYLGQWLRRVSVPFVVRNTEAGEPYPDTLAGYDALAILGGEMSANDDMPSLRQAEALFLEADARGVPTLGHCLGGQLMARALGAPVAASLAPEIGWQRLQLADSDLARAWFGEVGERVVFHWHYESFALPPAAELLATSAACPNQAFGLGPHLGMQFHIEVDAEKVRRWSREESPGYAAAQAVHATVQGGAGIRGGLARHLAAHQRMADAVYRRWLSQCGIRFS